MKEKFRNFMIGRYGVDELSKFLVVLGLICVILNLLLKNDVVYYIAMLTLVLYYYRSFSKNHAKRYAENQKFLVFRNKLRYHWDRKKSEMNMRKIYHVYKCPSCGQKIRVPKGKGKIMVSCPKCRKEFAKKS